MTAGQRWTTCPATWSEATARRVPINSSLHRTRRAGDAGIEVIASQLTKAVEWEICPGPSVRLIYGWGAVVPFMVRTRRIRECVYLC